MSNDNQLTIVGTVTRDPELRFTTGGAAICSFGVAWNPRKRDADGNWTNGDTTFFNCTAWRDMGENVAASVVKGTRVIVTGEVSSRGWEDKEGNARTSVEINVNEIGPSLRWATAVIDKTERERPAGNNGGGGDEQVYGDEEPFS